MNELPAILYIIVRDTKHYSCSSVWGEFDTLKLRAIDDLFWSSEATKRSVYAWSVEPQLAEPQVEDETRVVALPTQVALERIYFHISEPDALVLDATTVGPDCAVPQREVSVMRVASEARVVERTELPGLIGAMASERKAFKSPLLYAEKALRKGAFFEAFALGACAHQASEGNADRAWFCELFSRSFFGLADEALAAYDEYPGRGSAEPRAQLLAARYRLLLRQFNEARTILHTLAFHPELGAMAQCEMARSYLIEKDFARAIDVATSAIQKDGGYSESYLVRGIAHRGVSYEAGDAEGLRQAHSDFERVARQGSYSIPEALYHVGTVCARLGSLRQAEMAFRQSLFQRDRISARDALIRLLGAREKWADAELELERLEQIDSTYARTIREQIGDALQRSSTRARGGSTTSTDNSGTVDFEALWSREVSTAVEAARLALSNWGIPLRNELSDCVWLDQMINRFAPDGDFPVSGEFSALSGVEHRVIARALALHIGAMLVAKGAATWSRESADLLSLVFTTLSAPVPLERFVSERILLGASGDNFSALESLALEVENAPIQSDCAVNTAWWPVASASIVAGYREEALWAKDRWVELGAKLTGALSDLDEIDRIIDEVFAPGGMLQDGVSISFGKEMDRFVRGTGFLVGGIIADRVPTEWSDHDRAEGISLFNKDLGRVLPVARAQRRLYLASAADFSSKLSSLAWAAAAASVTEGIRSGAYRDARGVRAALISSLPSIEQFPESELSGVVESLLIGATLK